MTLLVAKGEDTMKHITKLFKGSIRMFLFLILFLPAAALCQVPPVDWIEGPGTVDLGNNLASDRKSVV